jgi:exopolysaccharide/PEP-CTERM locus tyrosine autokinase
MMSRIENALEKAARMRALENSQPIEPTYEYAHSEPTIVSPRNSCLVTVAAPDSPVAEEYRKLKAMVIKMTRQKALGNVIMVTSSTSGEGKSLTSINLAVSLAAEVNHRALLVDADLRRSSLAAYLGIEATVGLSDCLSDGVSLSTAITGTTIPQLDLLPAGKGVQNPVELLSSPKMRSLIGELRRRYPEQYVIIDTPPALPFAETQVISTLADSVLFIVKEGESTAQDLQDSMEILQGSRLLGVVFNDVTAVGMHDRYRHYYRYYAEQKRQEA